MARKVFYSFHYERDAWRAAQVRNSNAIADEDEYGVIDGVEWEKIEREGDDAIKRWIRSQLQHTSVTVVLIGTETASRRWVNYEIVESWKRGNAILGIRIHNMKNQESKTDFVGANPLEKIQFTDGALLSSVCKTYDWIANDGRTNMGRWVDDAFDDRDKIKKAGDKVIKETEELAKSVAAPTVATGASREIRNPPRPWAR